MKILPLARSENIVVQELGKEALIYDLNTHKAFNLNETSAIVYKACDGLTSFKKLTAEHKFTDEIIFLALDELKKQNLIEDSYDSPFAGMNRREVIRKVGLASMVALPVISSLVAPTAMMAQSAGGCVNPGGAPAGTARGSGGYFGTCDLSNQAQRDAICTSNYGSTCCSGTVVATGGCANIGFFAAFDCTCA